MARGQSQSRRAGEEIELDCSSAWPWELEQALGGKSKTQGRRNGPGGSAVPAVPAQERGLRDQV